MKYGGWMGKIVDVDLSSGEIKEHPLEEDLALGYLGGRGMNARFLHDETSARTGSLDPDNVLIFSGGPLMGTKIPMCNRGVVTTKSPLGYYAMSLFGGFFTPELKYAGYDAILIRGKATKPSLIWIDNGVVRIEDASDLWGMGTFETQERIKKKYGEKVSVACIGPAGEKSVRIAAIRANERTAGRGGVGAVMGSKNLKALAVKGESPVPVHDKAALDGLVKELAREIKEKPLRPKFPDYGTLESHETVNELGIFPSRNWQSGMTNHIEAISLEKFLQFRLKKHMPCDRCPIRCANTFRLKSGKYSGMATDGPEYETVAAFGGMTALRSPEAIIYANQLCNDLGLDTISTGGVIAFGQECFERGLVTRDFAGYDDFGFDNNEAVLDMIERIANRRGKFAYLLGEGMKIASEEIGGDSEKFAIHVKGLEPGMYDPRGAIGMALIYAISNRGACHHSQGHTVKKEVVENTRFDTSGKGTIVKNLAQYRILADSLTFCGFITGAMGWRFVDLLTSVTGNTLTTEGLKLTSDRINTLERLFLVREGVTRVEDCLPPRFHQDPLPEGIAEGRVISPEDLGKMIDEYYASCGWNENGIPTDDTLDKLNLTR